MKRILVFTAVVAIIAVSCEDRIDLLDSIPPVVTKTEVYQFAEAQTELGNTIEIPYTIDNLKKALETLPPETKAAIKEEDFAPTHYYVRFAPKDMAELDLLINLSPRVIWSEVPLDREVITGGIYYHDPSLPEDRPTYQYSTVSISRWPALDTLSVEHEILLEAFMPDYEDVPDTKTSSSENILSPELESLLRKAYEMAGQEYESVGMTKGSTWYPSGYIKAYDNFAGIVPISKVRVRGTHLLKVEETLTTSSGYFKLVGFKNPVSLKVIWESDDWDIRYGLVGQATYDGPTLEGAMWNLTIQSYESGSCHMAAMHRAAHRMYYGYIYNMSRPSYSRKLKMSYMESTLNNGTTVGLFNPVGVMGSLPDIQVAGYDNVGIRDITLVFSTTCHELGHATHYTNGNLYGSTDDSVRESWARFVQYLLTIREYTDRNCVSLLFHYNNNGMMIPDDCYNFQVPNGSTEYTPAFIDLYDNYNQFAYYNYNAPVDVIAGFPPVNIQNVVFASTSLADAEYELRAYVDNHPNNSYNMTYDTIHDIIGLYYWVPSF